VKLLGWWVTVVVLSFAVVVLVYPYISGQMEILHAVSRSRARYYITESLSTLDLNTLLSEGIECDRFLSIDETLPDLLPIVPSGERGFLVKFCEPTTYRLNGVPPPVHLAGVVGISAMVGELANSGDSTQILQYSPTNGTYSSGDLLFRIERGADGNLSVPDSGITLGDE
jgi:hypothetical protein